MRNGDSEFDLIREYFSFSTLDSSVALGVGDDGAVLRPAAGAELIVVVDTLIEGVHFPQATPAAAVGHRALSVNLSDVAAMGGVARWATLALTLPNFDRRWLGDFANGLAASARMAGVSLVGGDTTRGPLSVSLQLIAEVPAGTAIRRDGGQPGDELWVSGTCGDAAAGLKVFQATGGGQSTAEEYLVERFLWPTPRGELGRSIRDYASAAIDISDGLLADLRHILTASGCGAFVDVALLPLSSALMSQCPDQATELALTGGDDYELLFCVPPNKSHRVPRDQARRIGHLRSGNRIELRDNEAAYSLPEQLGYDHFEHPAS